MTIKKLKYKSIMFTKVELKAAWLSASNYTAKTNNARENAAQARVAGKFQKALLEIML